MNSTSSYFINFKYKGNRSYVQGPDIFNSVEKVSSSHALGYISELRFNFPLRSNAIFVSGNDMNGFASDSFCASGTLTSMNNIKRSFALLPLPDSHIENRYEYTEEEITNVLAINEEEKSGTLSSPAKYSLIEEIVASIKFVNSIFCLPGNKKWLFTGISLKSQMPASRLLTPLTVVRRQIIANRFSKNEIFLGPDHFGTVDFTLGEL